MNAESLRQSDPETSIPALLEYAKRPVSLEELSAITRTPIHRVRNILTPMMIEGQVEETEDKHYKLA